MTEYLILNSLISLWVLLVVGYLLKDARHQFYLLIFGLLCWLLPFGLIDLSTNINLIAKTQPLITTIKQPVQTLMTQANQADFSWLYLFALLMILGVFRFVFDAWQLHKQHKIFIQQGASTVYENVFTIKGLNNACVTGFKPCMIWIDEALYYSDVRTSVMSHEQQHIKQADPYWLLLIAFLERLFWFNPLVYLLAKQSKLTMELKCDQACQKQLPEKVYQNQMAKILLKMNHKTTSMNNFMAQSRKNHIYRIQQLSQEKTMKKFQKALLGLSFIAVSSLSIAALLSDKVVKDVDLKVNWKFWEYRSGISNTRELNSIITVNNIEFKEFNIGSGYKLRVKAECSNPGHTLANYIIYSEIIHNKAFKNSHSKPIVSVFENESKIIRIVDDGLPNLHMVELSFMPLVKP